MNILLVREYPHIDGTFTLLLRLARQMHKDGHQVWFVLFPGLDAFMVEEFGKCATLIKKEELEDWHREGKLPAMDAIHGIAGGDLLLWIYGYLKKKLFPSAKVLIGVYHPRAYIYPDYFIPSPDALFYKKLFTSIPEENLLFMNDEVKRSHAQYFQRSFAASPVIPIPVDIPAVMPLRRDVDRNKIVSIGRLVPFKNYITPMITVLEKLREKGKPFSFHIYGDGPLRGQLTQLIAACPEGDYHLHGAISYDQLEEVLQDAGLFIGMGTSVIEASGAGVPSLLAKESSTEETSYGWFFKTSGYHVGEQVDGWTEYPMEQQLLELAALDEDSYQQYCVQSHRRALDFETAAVIRGYYSFIANADAGFGFSYNAWQRFWLRAGRQPFKYLVKSQPSH